MLFLVVLLLALPIQSVAKGVRCGHEDERTPFQSVAKADNPIKADFFDEHQLCDEEQLSEMASKVHYAKNEMIITRLITRDQFSKFVLSNGVYDECTKLLNAFEAGELSSTLKNLIESYAYSSTPLADEDLSRFAQAMSYAILPGDMQAAVRTSGAVPAAVLGMSTYLERNPNSREFIMSSLVDMESQSLGLQRIYLAYQLGSYNILSGALGLALEVHPVSTQANVTAFQQQISDNYDKFSPPAKIDGGLGGGGGKTAAKLMQARFVPLGGLVDPMRTQLSFYDEDDERKAERNEKLEGELEGLAWRGSARGKPLCEGGSMVSAIICAVFAGDGAQGRVVQVGVVSEEMHEHMR
jgi:hypothetical protein